MRRLLSRRQRRGLSWNELSEESGVPRSTLCWWHRRVREEDVDRSGSRFVRLVASQTPVPETTSPVEIVLDDGRRVVVRPGFDVGHLRRVLEALGP